MEYTMHVAAAAMQKHISVLYLFVVISLHNWLPLPTHNALQGCHLSNARVLDSLKVSIVSYFSSLISFQFQL